MLDSFNFGSISFAVAALGSVNLRLALGSAAMLGFRHGLDYDHIAAISDITSIQDRPGDALRYGLLYVGGHAATIAVLGGAAIAARISLPAGSDRWAEALVGATLLMLGIYVLGTLFRPSTHSHARPRTRITLLINGVLWVHWRLSRILGGSRAQPRQAFEKGYGTTSTFLVGVIHGLGAETPTQILLFLMAANLGGTAFGLLGLAMFILGLLVMNTLMCASLAGIFRVTLRRPQALWTLTALTSGYSVVVGVIFLLGSAGKLPSLSG